MQKSIDHVPHELLIILPPAITQFYITPWRFPSPTSHPVVQDLQVAVLNRTCCTVSYSSLASNQVVSFIRMPVAFTFLRLSFRPFLCPVGDHFRLRLRQRFGSFPVNLLWSACPLRQNHGAISSCAAESIEIRLRPPVTFGDIIRLEHGKEDQEEQG